MDREKVIRQIEKCINDGFCGECKYIKHVACKHYLLSDALRLIKEQKQRIGELENKISLMKADVI